MPTDTGTELFTEFASVDWNNLAAVTAASDKLLTALDAQRGVLRELAEHAIGTPELLALCGHYDILDKIVLYDDPTGWRLRLHVFLPGYFDGPTTTAGPTAVASCTAATATASMAPKINSATAATSTWLDSSLAWCAQR
ncbi:MAG: hypothetical protein M3460_14035 [Actinomycetota bacterium]|nr:hypothetical protein [Actinomycetota bacterium]